MTYEGSPSACPLCWKNKHQCRRKSSSDRCRSCSNKIIVGQNDVTATIRYTRPFPCDEIDANFKVYEWQELSPFPGPEILDFNVLELDIVTIASPQGLCLSTKIEQSLTFSGRLCSENVNMHSLERSILERYSSHLNSRVDSGLILSAILAGALLEVICSAYDIYGQVRSFENDVPIVSHYPERLLSLDLRRMLLFRVGNIIDNIMDAIRSTDQVANHASLSAYTAASLLYIDIDHFTRSLKHGQLSASIPPGLEGPFLDWLVAISTELSHRLVEGCERFSAWTTLIGGSRKLSRRHPNPLKICLHLRQMKNALPLQVWNPQFVAGDEAGATFMNAPGPPLLPSTGPGFHFEPQYFYNPSEDLDNQSHFSPQMDMPNLGPPLLMDDALASHSSYPDPDPDPLPNHLVIGDMLGEPSSAHDLHPKLISDNGYQGTHSPADPATLSWVDETMIDPRLLSQDGRLDPHHQYALN